MSELKSRLPSKPKKDVEAFITGAEQRTAAKETPASEGGYPWDALGVRDDVFKLFNVRLSEPYFLKLKYISENTPSSMQKFCLGVLQEAIDLKIKELTE